MRMLHVEFETGSVNIECEYIKESNGVIFAMNKGNEMVGAFTLGAFEMLYLSESRGK